MKRIDKIKLIEYFMDEYKEIDKEELNPTQYIIIHPVDKPLKHLQEVISVLYTDYLEVLVQYNGKNIEYNYYYYEELSESALAIIEKALLSYISIEEII